MTLLAEPWIAIHDGDERALGLYLRHYSSRKRWRGAIRQFVGPGEHMVLLTPDARAVFVWRYERYRLDGQTGANCSIFRNEGAARSSDLIHAAAARVWERWPGARLYTYVDPEEVSSPNPGYCFKVAGWRFCGRSSKGLHILEILP